MTEDRRELTELLDVGLADRRYGFPLDRVLEVVPSLRTVAVPLAPSALIGLASMRGQVLPVISLRACCGLPPGSGAGRVVVIEMDSRIGLAVDVVHGVLSLALEPAQGTVDATCTDSTAARLVALDDGGVLAPLDLDAALAEFFSPVKRARTYDAVSADDGETTLSQRDYEASDGTVELVSFSVAGQEYMLPVAEVQEVVKAASIPASLPGFGGAVEGVLDLRGRLMPVLNLAEMLGEVAACDEGPGLATRVLVVPQADRQGEEHLLGLRVDAVLDVIRVPQDSIAALPPTVGGAGSGGAVQSICRLEEGRRLVSLLEIGRLLGQQDAIVEHDEMKEEPVLAGGAQMDVEDFDDEPLVVFGLKGDEYSFEVGAVREIVRVPERLVHVPGLPGFIDGVINLRGEVLPVVDLRRRLAMGDAERTSEQRIVVADQDGIRAGFLVDGVTEVLKIGAEHRQSAPSMGGCGRTIERVLNLKDGRMILALRVGGLLDAGQREALATAELIPAGQPGRE